MLEAWFDARFLAAAAREHAESRVRIGMALCAGLLLFAVLIDWRLTAGWTAAAMALELSLRRITNPLAEGRPLDVLQATGALLFQILLMCAWSFAGVLIWSGGDAMAMAAAMSFFATLLFYLATQRAGSPALLVAALPALIAPLLAPILFPRATLLEEFVLLMMNALVVGLSGWVMARSLVAPVAVTAAARPADIGQPSLESLTEAKAEAEAANQAKSAFLAIMSHEIRTPLNGMLGMTQALACDPALNSSQRQRLAVIRQSGESLLSILNDILDLSKIEAGKLEIENIAFDVGELARAAHESFTALAAQKGLKCRLDIDPAAEGHYLGDPTRLRQILYNLISNALKFTEAGEIRVSVDAERGGLRFSVADTGVGIDAAQLERLFQKFEQADASSTRRYGGTGLGLAICRDLTALMRGSIDVESEPGEGTTFIVSLPLTRIAENPMARPARGFDLKDFDLGGLRILAAEDNPTNQLVLKALLGPAGVDPTMVEDGAQAVEAWSVGDFDLILMDIQMPRMDGIAAARTIREEETRAGRARTPIIALTANAMAHQVEEYFEAGMDGHLAKPVDMAALYSAIESARTHPLQPPAPARRAN
jgi:signal transduction histidine kinase/ActR/RegA family two-component response regulator